MDASVAVQWVAVESGREAALDLLERSDLVAPDLLLVEVANVLRRKASAGDLSSGQEQGALAEIVKALRLERVGKELVERALTHARVMNHPVYDCVYIALTEQLGASFATFDGRLIARMRKHGLSELVADLPDQYVAP